MCTLCNLNALFACLTLCNPMDCSPPGSSVHGIFQVRILESVAISFPREIFPTHGSKLCLLDVLHWQVDYLQLSHLWSPWLYMCACMLSYLSCVQLFVTLWTIACQIPLSMGFSRPEYWSQPPFLLQGICPTHGSNQCLLGLQHGQVDFLSLSQLWSP